MKYDNLVEILINEIFNNKIEYKPIFNKNDAGKDSVSQEFIVKDKTYRVRADMFDADKYKNILHIEFVRIDSNKTERTDLTKDNTGYTGDIYGIVINWVKDVMHDPIFKNIEHVIIIGENDDLSWAKGKFYEKLALRFIKDNPNYTTNKLLSDYMYTKISPNKFSITAVTKKG